MTKDKKYTMLAGKERRVATKKAERRDRNRFGATASRNGAVRNAPASGRADNRFSLWAADKRSAQKDAPAASPGGNFTLLAGRDRRLNVSKNDTPPERRFTLLAGKDRRTSSRKAAFSRENDVSGETAQLIVRTITIPAVSRGRARVIRLPHFEGSDDGMTLAE